MQQLRAFSLATYTWPGISQTRVKKGETSMGAQSHEKPCFCPWAAAGSDRSLTFSLPCSSWKQFKSKRRSTSACRITSTGLLWPSWRRTPPSWKLSKGGREPPAVRSSMGVDLVL